ncbi:hypothetical protein SXCC_03737 [Gluconacetobacter sp. SXCC-1]|nr:hypothetical protein SXCC_03737 [Gluconacetobacter sp. SXCC-1]
MRYRSPGIGLPRPDVNMMPERMVVIRWGFVVNDSRQSDMRLAGRIL